MHFCMYSKIEIEVILYYYVTTILVASIWSRKSLSLFILNPNHKRNSMGEIIVRVRLCVSKYSGVF